MFEGFFLKSIHAHKARLTQKNENSDPLDRFFAREHFFQSSFCSCYLDCFSACTTVLVLFPVRFCVLYSFPIRHFVSFYTFESLCICFLCLFELNLYLCVVVLCDFLVIVSLYMFWIYFINILQLVVDVLCLLCGKFCLFL